MLYSGATQSGRPWNPSSTTMLHECIPRTMNDAVIIRWCREYGYSFGLKPLKGSLSFCVGCFFTTDSDVTWTFRLSKHLNWVRCRFIMAHQCGHHPWWSLYHWVTCWTLQCTITVAKKILDDVSACPFRAARCCHLIQVQSCIGQLTYASQCKHWSCSPVRLSLPRPIYPMHSHTKLQCPRTQKNSVHIQSDCFSPLLCHTREDRIFSLQSKAYSTDTEGGTCYDACCQPVNTIFGKN